MAKKLNLDDLVAKAQEEGLASLTTRQLELLSTSGRINPADVKTALDTRLKIARIDKTKRPVGRPSKRSQTETTTDEAWIKAQEERILNLTDEEAHAELTAQMSPIQNDLIMLTRLRRIMDNGGKAGADAGRLIFEMQKRHLAPIKRTVFVKIQTAG